MCSFYYFQLQVTEIQLKLLPTNEGEVLVTGLDEILTKELFLSSRLLHSSFSLSLHRLPFSSAVTLSVCGANMVCSQDQLFSYYLAFSFHLALSYCGNLKGIKKLLTLLYIVKGRFWMSFLDLPSPCTNPCGRVATTSLIEVAENSFLNGKKCC